MNETNIESRDGKGSKLGIAVLNPVVLPGSTSSNRQAVVDLKFGKLVFKGLACNQEEGQEPNITLPWDTELVGIHDGEDREEINQQVRAKVGAVLAGLKHSGTKGLWSSVS